jgi:hypothetical protein
MHEMRHERVSAEAACEIPHKVLPRKLLDLTPSAITIRANKGAGQEHGDKSRTLLPVGFEVSHSLVS